MLSGDWRPWNRTIARHRRGGWDARASCRRRPGQRRSPTVSGRRDQTLRPLRLRLPGRASPSPSPDRRHRPERRPRAETTGPFAVGRPPSGRSIGPEISELACPLPGHRGRGTQPVPQVGQQLIDPHAAMARRDELLGPCQIRRQGRDGRQRFGPAGLRGAPERTDVRREEQTEHRELISPWPLHLRPSRGDEVVQMAGLLDTGEQRIREPGSGPLRWARAGSNRHTSDTVRGSTIWSAAPRSCPRHRSLPSAFISACASDVPARRSSPGSCSIRRFRPVATTVPSASVITAPMPRLPARADCQARSSATRLAVRARPTSRPPRLSRNGA